MHSGKTRRPLPNLCQVKFADKTLLLYFSEHLLASSVVNTAEEELQDNVPRGIEYPAKSTKYNAIACPVCQVLKPKNCPAFPPTIISIQKLKKISRTSSVKTTLSK